MSLKEGQGLLGYEIGAAHIKDPRCLENWDSAWSLEGCPVPPGHDHLSSLLALDMHGYRVASWVSAGLSDPPFQTAIMWHFWGG